MLVLAQEEFSDNVSEGGALFDPTLSGLMPKEVLTEETVTVEQTPTIEEELNETTAVVTEPEVRPRLASVVNGRSIDADAYIKEYLRINNNFQDLAYETITDDTTTTMYDGNGVEENVKGFSIDNQLYAVQLVICDEGTKACYFRINGVPTGAFHAKDDEARDGIRLFDLSEEYALGIISIRFNDCGDRRFCDIYWDEQDIVELEIKRK